MEAGGDSQERADGAVQADPEVGNDAGTLSLILEERKNAVKSLQYQLARKEADLRRATEESYLMQELKTINQLTLRKAQNADSFGTEGRLAISDDALAEVIANEAKIKLATKETAALEAEAALVASQADDVEAAIAQKSEMIEMVIAQTGYERTRAASRGFVNEDNRFREHQKILMALDEKQRTYSLNTAALTLRIESLTAEIDARKSIDDDLVAARQMLKERQAQANKLEDDKKSLLRIMQRKDALLKSHDKQDDHKTIKQLEGDKRVLHAELGRCAEAITTNRKSIVAQAGRIRQLEARLASVNSFIRSVLDNDDTSEEDQPVGIARGATSVPLAQFEGLQAELAISRSTIEDRDQQLLQCDAKVEQLERKVQILATAMVTRTATTIQEEQELERECAVLANHLDLMKDEFDREYAKLMVENEQLQAKVSAQQSQL
jgi:hypothetical protein